MAAHGTLAGFTFGITADRRWSEQAMLLERRGARVVHAPTIRTLPLGDQAQLDRATRAVIADPPDVVVLTTGLGARGWFAAAASLDLDDQLVGALTRARVLARGPKAAGAATTAGLTVAWRAPSERSGEVIDHLGDVAGARIVVQRDGAAEPELADELAARGADVVDVAVYRWERPDDAGPARRLVDLVCDRQVDAVTFTSGPAVTNLVAIARDVDRDADLLAAFGASDVRAVCVGPVCAERAEREGIAGAVAPDPGRLGAMIRVAEEAFATCARHATVGGERLFVQGTAVVVGDAEPLGLSDRERALLETLLDAEGAVVGKADLVERVWAGAADEHVVEVTIGRLRTRLGRAGHGVVTVPRRGYRLDVTR